MLKTALAKLLTVKIAALVIATGGVGGVALAAGTGNLPEPVQRHLPGATSSASHRPHPSGAPSAANPSVSAQALGNLCRKYAERDNDHRRAALENDSEFRDLVDRAGSRDRDKVDKFCDDMRKPHPSGSWSHPSGWQSDRPGLAPSDRPGGAPAGQPGPLPSDRSGGAPVSRGAK
jgi:hypothetical protein